MSGRMTTRTSAGVADRAPVATTRKRDNMDMGPQHEDLKCAAANKRKKNKIQSNDIVDGELSRLIVFFAACSTPSRD